MSNARKCDRCGDFYKEYGVLNDCKNPNGIMFVSINAERKYWSYEPIDLCPDCLKELIRFVKRPVIEVKVE